MIRMMRELDCELRNNQLPNNHLNQDVLGCTCSASDGIGPFPGLI